MSKKIIYVNTQTNKSVNYGDMISFTETLKFGEKLWKSRTSLPVINSTIPTLIEKGILVQKEVNDDTQNSKVSCNVTEINKCLDSIIQEITNLKAQLNAVLKND